MPLIVRMLAALIEDLFAPEPDAPLPELTEAVETDEDDDAAPVGRLATRQGPSFSAARGSRSGATQG